MSVRNILFMILIAGFGILLLIGSIFSGVPGDVSPGMFILGAIFIGAAVWWFRSDRKGVKRLRGTSVTELTLDCVPPRKIDLSKLNTVPGLTGNAREALNAFISYCRYRGDWVKANAVDIQTRGYVAMDSTTIETSLNSLIAMTHISVTYPYVRRGSSYSIERTFEAEDSLIVFLENAVIKI